MPETTEIRRILPYLPLRTRWILPGGDNKKALQLAEQRGLAHTVQGQGQWRWTEWQLTPEGREWLAQWAKCSLCGSLTSEHAGCADWYLCGRCEGTPEAEAAGYTHTTLHRRD